MLAMFSQQSVPTLSCETPNTPGSVQWTTEAAKRFGSAGCTIFENLFELSQVEALHACVMAQCEHHLEDRSHDDATKVGHRRFVITPRLEGPLNSPLLYHNQRLMPVLQQVLGDGLVLGSLVVEMALPGAQDQNVHLDHPPLFGGVGNLHGMLPTYAVTVVMPLVPLGNPRGTTRVWPGSHVLDPGRAGLHLPLNEAVDPAIGPGDCMLMDYRLVHGGTANRSLDPRPVIYLVYNRPWFRDCENYARQQRLSISSEEFARIPIGSRYLFESERGRRLRD